MKKTILKNLILLLIFGLLAGCRSIEDKSASVSAIYCATTVFSMLLLAGYAGFIKKKQFWFWVLFVSVFVVNAGYFTLSVSTTLEMALNANRISYLGSVFLPLSMIMIIIDVCKLECKQWFRVVLVVVSILVFFIAASPGYLDIYYKSVTLSNVNGVAVLDKVYGPWHKVYLFYLIGYFTIMIATILHAFILKKLDSFAHSLILLISVFVNLAVWFLEQLTKIDFEFLSVSYIITELFLIGLYLMIQNQERELSALRSQLPNVKSPHFLENRVPKQTKDYLEHCKFFSDHISTLTATERLIFNCYLDGKGTKDVLNELNIAENTLKYHNKNIYSKLGVSSRKQLLEYAKALKLKKE